MTKLEFVCSDEKSVALLRAARAFDEGIELKPVRHARWQFEARGKDGITELPVCSWCGATPKYYAPKNSVGMQVPPYCHECGCKMDAEVKHETFHPEPS